MHEDNHTTFVLLPVLVGEKAVPPSTLVCLFPMGANHFRG